SHGAHLGLAEIPPTMLWMDFVKSLRDQGTYRLADQIPTFVAKNVLQLLTRKNNNSVFVDHQGSVGRGIHHITKHLFHLFLCCNIDKGNGYSIRFLVMGVVRTYLYNERVT